MSVTAMTGHDLESGGEAPAAALLQQPELGLVRVAGRDRATFLQGLLTNDVLAVPPGAGCYAAYLTPQGRMITDLTVLVGAGSILLAVPAPVRGSLAARLDGLVFTEDVRIEDLSATWSAVALYGSASATVLQHALDRAGIVLESVAPLDRWREHDHAMAARSGGVADQGRSGDTVLIAACHDFAGMGFTVHAPGRALDELNDVLLQSGARRVTPAMAEAARLERGRPAFGIDMDEHTIPLEAGIEDRAISQSKGCYVGQEVIIRVLHRGHGRVARKLVGLAIDTPGGGAHGRPAIAPGTEIASGDRTIGHVTSAAWSPSLRQILALGYVHRDFAEPGTQLIVRHDQREISATVRQGP